MEALGAQPGLPKANHMLKSKLTAIKGLVALWDFKELPGNDRQAEGRGKFPLMEFNGPISRVDEGPLSGYSIRLNGDQYLSLGNDKTDELNIYGKDAQVTVIAWIKWTGEQTGFIGGMWNEYQEGGKRQYGLFVSLPHYNGANQVCGHISYTGKATAPFPYSIDYSASKQVVPVDKWSWVAFTYDGQYIKSYLNGEFEERPPELINNTKGFDGYPDGLIQSKNPYYFPNGMNNNESDFTVGAVLLKRGMGNYFKGLIGGIVVYNRALSENELRHIGSK